MSKKTFLLYLSDSCDSASALNTGPPARGGMALTYFHHLGTARISDRASFVGAGSCYVAGREVKHVRSIRCFIFNEMSAKLV